MGVCQKIGGLTFGDSPRERLLKQCEEDIIASGCSLFDPALLRSGRMDMHIYMSYCSYPALKILLKNYLGDEESDLDVDVLKELEEVIDKAEMTPADISEVLIKNRRYKQKAVSELLQALKTRVLEKI